VRAGMWTRIFRDARTKMVEGSKSKVPGPGGDHTERPSTWVLRLATGRQSLIPRAGGVRRWWRGRVGGPWRP